jgi:hypothetical protein
VSQLAVALRCIDVSDVILEDGTRLQELLALIGRDDVDPDVVSASEGR